ncbi:hypothetical protein WA026_005673 [Henosepilachna vigintioctopunctata]|uniref:Uncharacterized protein n=1 Tax=Henosepilachna vigintioctopunctata TaxID=420089 RepID=A0AAW1U1M3_9CUCU
MHQTKFKLQRKLLEEEIYEPGDGTYLHSLNFLELEKLDAEYFLQGSCGSHYMYLETIQEETSDDLQSDSDLSEARYSPVGWLATDSEAGSVICVEKGMHLGYVAMYLFLYIFNTLYKVSA